MSLFISSPQNPRIKDAVRLRDQRHRTKQGRFLIDGAREITRALDAGLRFLEVFACEDLCTTEKCKAAIAKINDSCDVTRVSLEVFAKLAYGDRQDGIIVVAALPPVGLDSLRIPNDRCVCVLEGIEKPGNVGAVIRSADGAGIAAVICANGGTDLYNPNAIRASLGTIFQMPIRSATSAETLAWLRERQARIYAARVEGSLCYTDVDYSGSTAIVLGSEANGLSDIWHGPDITPISIPMHGIADSLNVSSAAAILCYESQRHRWGS